MAAAEGVGVVRQLRVVVTADDYDEAVAFYRDALGLPEEAAYASADGRVTILEAGRATLEIADPAQAAFIDQVEVGRRVAGHIRMELAERPPGGTGGPAAHLVRGTEAA